MELFIGSIKPLKQNTDAVRETPAVRPARDRDRDRRERKQDRRRNVREGVFVSLSIKGDQRSPQGRKRSGI